MTQAPAAIFKIPTDSPQVAPGRAAKPPVRAKKAPGTLIAHYLDPDRLPVEAR